MNEQTIEISLERYTELIQKEVIYDEVMKDKDISLYLYNRVEEVTNNA